MKRMVAHSGGGPGGGGSRRWPTIRRRPPIRWNRSCARQVVRYGFGPQEHAGRGPRREARSGDHGEGLLRPQAGARGSASASATGKRARTGSGWSISRIPSTTPRSAATESSASYNAIEFGGKGYLWTRAPVLPYLQVGVRHVLLHVRGRRRARRQDLRRQLSRPVRQRRRRAPRPDGPADLPDRRRHLSLFRRDVRQGAGAGQGRHQPLYRPHRTEAATSS